MRHDVWCTLTCSEGLSVKKAEWTDILEHKMEGEENLMVNGSLVEIPLDFRGFEIKTLRLVLA